MMLGMSDGTKKVSIKSAVETTVNKATSWLKGLKNLSPTWGKDMMSGMSEGMRNACLLYTSSLDNDETSISEKEFKALKKENAELKKSADPKVLEKNKALKDKLKAVEKELEELKKADE